MTNSQKSRKKEFFESVDLKKNGSFSVSFRPAAQPACGCQSKSFAYSVKTESVFTERILACCGMYISFLPFLKLLSGNRSLKGQ